MIGRVRRLIHAVDEGEGAERESAQGALLLRRDQTVDLQADLEALQVIDDRLARLHIFFPDVKVGKGPLLAKARAIIEDLISG